MVRAGWYRESFRHSLAARGIQTKKYMAPKFLRGMKDKFTSIVKQDVLHKELGEPVLDSEKSQEERVQDVVDIAGGPRTTTGAAAERRIKSGVSVEKVAADVVIGTRDIEVAFDNLDKGRPAKALSLLAEARQRRLSSDNVSQLKTALGSYAMSLAQSGAPVPKDIKNKLDSNFKVRIDALEAMFARESESPLKTQLRQLGRDATAATVDALPSLLGQVGREGALSQLSSKDQEFEGLSKEIDDLDKTPFFDPVNPHGEGGRSGANAFIDDKGKFGDFDIPHSSDMFNFQPLASGGSSGNVNIVMKDEPGKLVEGVDNLAVGKGGAKMKTAAESVSEQVESLHSERAKLSEVDLSAFDVGNKAFKSGDREGLISAITELQSQEGKLKDRWDLVGQTHAQLKGVQNHDSSFMKKSGGLFGFGGGSGANRLVKQTEQLSDVRGEIMKSSNEAFGRRKMLEFRLQRLDSQVPPETWVPGEITRFSDDAGKNLSGLFERMTGM